MYVVTFLNMAVFFRLFPCIMLSMKSSRNSFSFKNILRPIVIVVLFFLAIIISFTVNDKTHPSKHILDSVSQVAIFKHENPSNGSTSIHQSKLQHREFDVVLSYYAENVEFVRRLIEHIRNVPSIKKLNPYVIVYNKNPNVDIKQLKNALKADSVKTLPNLGREGATFLSHIIENYDTVATHIFFSQAEVEGITNTGLEPWLMSRLDKQFNRSVGYMPLVVQNMISTYYCGKGPYGDFPRLAELWSILEHQLCPPKGQSVSFRGQFLVSRKRILSRPLNVYKYIQSILTANASHWIHKDDNHGWFASAPHNPIFGHVVERLWTMLFRCTDPDLVERCKQEKCACYD